MELSIVIPSYRSERTIKRTIDSAIAEGVPPGNIIVVEDGVFDDTARVVRACEGVQLVTLEKNRGAPAARNVGLDKVATEYVMFLDADDYVENGLLSGLVRVLEQENGDVAIGPWRYDGEGRPRGVARIPGKLSNDEWICHWVRPVFFPPCSVAWRTSSVRRIGAWDEQLRTNDDGEIMIRAFLKGLAVSVSSTGNGVYWQHPSPYRVSIAKIDDLLHATEVVFRQLEPWAGPGVRKDIRQSNRSALGRYCCVTAWNAFAHDRNEVGMKWRARARAYGFNARGYSYATSLLAAFLGIRLSSKLKDRFLRPASFYKTISQRWGVAR
ncbi:glycosyltransferase family 2 protein [Frateuria soli]|uniref:glycosyltransferase family 2 protein n=1 Tax=Frateuria soli TaxID=1542730 RepID=UPI001E5E79EC|nr:glycosyltransferase family 2 protein [Frateuria soli]UGB38520.1 glycosyltransferase [Frateuria soli]